MIDTPGPSLLPMPAVTLREDRVPILQRELNSRARICNCEDHTSWHVNTLNAAASMTFKSLMWKTLVGIGRLVTLLCRPYCRSYYTIPRWVDVRSTLNLTVDHFQSV